MADFMSKADRSSHMAKIRSKDTKPELALRRALHAMGYRYRLHMASLPGKPDLVFPGRRKVVFVNGCFWHGHSCPVGSRLPKTNTDFWREKRERNQARDARDHGKLRELGWDCVVVWECRIKAEAGVPEEVLDYLGPVSAGSGRGAALRPAEDRPGLCQ